MSGKSANSVMRNRVKRIAKELLRRDGKALSNYDVLIVIKKSVKIDVLTIKQREADFLTGLKLFLNNLISKG